MTLPVPRARLLATALTLVLLAALPATAAPLRQSPSPTPDPGEAVGVAITPSRLQVDLTGRDVSVRILIVNNLDDPRRVRMSVAGLGHDLDGTPRFLEPSNATSALAVSPSQFVLQPAERKELSVQGAIPDGRAALYAAIIAAFEPLTPPTGQVETKTRVASLFLLRGPKPWVQTAKVVDVQVVPREGPGPLQVFAAVEDTGNVHIDPTGEITIYGADGAKLATVPLTGATLLPGFARRLFGTWTPPDGLSGPVRLVATIHNPDATGEGTADFSEGTPQVAQASIDSLAASSSGGAHVTLRVTNTCNVTIAPTVVLTANEGTLERARQVLVQPEIAPGESREVEWKPQLADGVYVVTAQALLDERLLDQDVVGLRVGAAKKSSWLWILLAILLLAAAAFLLFLWRRRRRSPERDGPERLTGRRSRRRAAR